MTMRSLLVLAAVATSSATSVGKSCNVCPFTPGSTCCNYTSHQVCPGQVECCNCGSDACECPPVPTKTVVELAVGTPDLSTLVTALKAADLVKTLNETGPFTAFTVFAPTNEAFAALPSGVLAELLKPENKAQLVKVLTYHVHYGEVHADMIKNGEKINTLEGENLTATVSSKGVQINNATVTTADIDATNGVVHIIDKVLLYPGFAPPAPHTPAPKTPAPVPPMPGCNKCPFTNTSVCCNSTDKAQKCPGRVECCDCGQEACECPAPPTENIVDLAAAKNLSTLVTALKAADLVKTLNETGPYTAFTVFAPTNEAFAALPSGVLAGLLKPENKAQLVKVLTYHVHYGEVYADLIKNGEEINTLEGANLTATVSSKGVQIGNATVTGANNYASNGVVHIIDAVLMPTV